jgi:hypothetical protein
MDSVLGGAFRRLAPRPCGRRGGASVPAPGLPALHVGIDSPGGDPRRRDPDDLTTHERDRGVDIGERHGGAADLETPHSPGSVDTRSSITRATWGLACTSRNFLVAPIAWRPTMMCRFPRRGIRRSGCSGGRRWHRRWRGGRAAGSADRPSRCRSMPSRTSWPQQRSIRGQTRLRTPRSSKQGCGVPHLAGPESGSNVPLTSYQNV